MNCMKCGRDIREGSVFCDSCLEDMRKYPVKPGIAIQLPNRKDMPGVKKAYTKRKPPTAEEQLARLKKRYIRLLLVWLVTVLLLVATVYPTFRYFTGSIPLLPGQNYSTVTGPAQP